MADPYREPPEAPPAAVPKPARRRRRWPWPLAALGAGAVAIAGAPVSAAVSVAVVVGAMTDAWVHVERRRKATRLLDNLPFGVVHQRPGAADPARRPSPISTVTVRLNTIPDDAAAVQLGRDLVAIANLSVAIDGDRITLTAWPWKADDLLLLAQVLETWGRRVHAAHHIAEVMVVWGDGGPTASI